jgi:NAD(P)-dependent dehydrogenase (short-subunit alcohol dehydrogenase family)
VGRAAAQAFARRGASVGLLARGSERLRAAAREVEQTGAHAYAAPVDVAEADEVERAAGAIEDALGPIDVWVNDAMTSVFAPLRDIRAAEFERVTDVTYLGVVYGTMAALRRMLPRDHGIIVQVGSALAYRGIPLQSAYCGAKHAVQGFTESVRCELLHDRSNVRVSMVQLPALNTPQFSWVRSRLPREPQPVPPIYQPEVAADAIVWAARHYRRELFVGAPTVATIIADRLVPGILDRYLGRTGYDSQQTSEPAGRDRPDNLWDAVPSDAGAHGSFDGRAHARSAQLWAARNRRWLGLGGLAAGVLAATRRAR